MAESRPGSLGRGPRLPHRLSGFLWEGYGVLFAEDVQMHFPGAIEASVSGRAARAESVQGIIRVFPYCVVARCEDGIIVEFDEYFDRLEMLGRLSLV